jgi:hypothetical protein
MGTIGEMSARDRKAVGTPVMSLLSCVNAMRGKFAA